MRPASFASMRSVADALSLRSMVHKFVLLAALTHTGAAQAADRMRLASVPLDMPLSDEEALDGQALEGLYWGHYGKNMPYNLS